MSEWISVQNQLPSEAYIVIVILEIYNVSHVGTAFYSQDDQCWYVAYQGNDKLYPTRTTTVYWQLERHNLKVTHWQYYPSPLILE